MAIRCKLKEYYSTPLDRYVKGSEKILIICDISKHVIPFMEKNDIVTVQDFVDHVISLTDWKLTGREIDEFDSYVFDSRRNYLMVVLGIKDVFMNPHKYFENTENRDEFEYLSDLVGSWDDFSNYKISLLKLHGLENLSSFSDVEKWYFDNNDYYLNSVQHHVVRVYPRKMLMDKSSRLYHIFEMNKFKGSEMEKILNRLSSSLLFSGVPLTNTEFPYNLVFEWYKMFKMDITYPEVVQMLNDANVEIITITTPESLELMIDKSKLEEFLNKIQHQYQYVTNVWYKFYIQKINLTTLAKANDTPLFDILYRLQRGVENSFRTMYKECAYTPEEDR